jgi:hypothetical protein
MQHLDVYSSEYRVRPLTRGSSSESFGIFWSQRLLYPSVVPTTSRRAEPSSWPPPRSSPRFTPRRDPTSHPGASDEHLPSSPRPRPVPRPHRALMPHARRVLSAEIYRLTFPAPFPSLPSRVGCGADNPASARARRPAPRPSPHPPSATPHPTPTPTRTPRSRDARSTTPPPANSSTSRLASTLPPGRPPSWRSCARSGDSSAGSWPYSSGGTSNQSWTPEGSTSSRYPSGRRNERRSLSMKQASPRRTSTRIQTTSATTRLN